MVGMIIRLVALSAFMAVAAIFASAVGGPTYPWKPTSLFAGAVLLEALAIAFVLRPRNRGALGPRSLLAASLAALALWFAAQDTLGAPEYVFMHQRWLAWMIVFCLGIASYSVVARFRRPQAV